MEGCLLLIVLYEIFVAVRSGMAKGTGNVEEGVKSGSWRVR